MSAKNRFPIDIDNRESKKSVVQRFMTSEESGITAQPQKTPEASENKRPEDHSVSKREKNEEKILDSEIEETPSEKMAKPFKSEKTQDDIPEPEQKERINPFVSAKPREPESKKEPKGKEIFPGTEPESSEIQSHSVDSGEDSTSFSPPPQAADTAETARTEDFAADAEDIEKIAENKGGVPGEIKKVWAEEDKGEEQTRKMESAGEIEVAAETENAYKTGSDIEEFDMSNIMIEVQDRIDELIQKSAQSDANSAGEIPGETEQIPDGEVIRRVQKRVYDHDDQSIAHYVELLEKNDIKTRFYFKNTMENAVVEEVEATLKRVGDICKCDRCFADICAITLNALKPHYVTTAIGELYNRVYLSDFEKLIEISSEVFKAVDYVKNNPRHK